MSEHLTVTREFGGVDMVTDPLDMAPNRSTLCTNLRVSHRGSLVTRPGSAEVYSGGAGDIYGGVKYGTNHLLVTRSATVAQILAITTAGVLTTSVNIACTAFDAADINSATYIATGSTGQIRKFDGSVFSAPAGLAAIEGNALAVQPVENRLVVADANNVGRLLFSNPDDPETFGATDFVDLGAPIAGLLSWREYLFAFAADRFWVFYGNAVDTVGGALFNYREVNVGVGIQPPSVFTGLDVGVAAGRDGVYLLGQDGVYVTTGDVPTCISGEIAALWEANGLSLREYAAPDNWWGIFALHDDEIVVTTSDGSWVFRESSGWSLYDLPDQMRYMVPGRGDTVAAYFTTGVQNTYLRKLDYALNTDPNGPEIVGQYSTGFFDLGSSDMKVVREFSVDCVVENVSIDVSLFAYGNAVDGASGTTGTVSSTGAFPLDVNREVVRQAVRGRRFSFLITGDAHWLVSELGVRLRDARSGR